MPLIDALNCCMDLVLTVDLTADKISFLSRLGDFLKSAYSVLSEKIEENKGEHLTGLRVRVVGFRGKGANEPFAESRFFSLPAEQQQLDKFVGSLRAYGQSDVDEVLPEAVFKAFTSDFLPSSEGTRVMRTVLIFTDARVTSGQEFPKILEPLAESFTPEVGKGFSSYPYRYVCYSPELPLYLDHLPINSFKSMYYPTKEYGELSEVDFEELVDFISV